MAVMKAKKITDIFFHSSKYSQRMRRLSCKIFNDYNIPELEKRDLDHGPTPQVISWVAKWHNDLRTVERNQEKPVDLDTRRNPHYYPAHPQFELLSHTLREYGLYRDEHRDFNEAMKAIAISKGKVFRERRGPISKKAAKK